MHCDFVGNRIVTRRSSIKITAEMYYFSYNTCDTAKKKLNNYPTTITYPGKLNDFSVRIIENFSLHRQPHPHHRTAPSLAAPQRTAPHRCAVLGRDIFHSQFPSRLSYKHAAPRTRSSFISFYNYIFSFLSFFSFIERKDFNKFHVVKEHFRWSDVCSAFQLVGYTQF